MKFGSVGAVAYVVAVGGFNALVHLPGAPLKSKPVTASIISGALSIMVAYIGNRHWTWRDRPKGNLSREISLFFALNLIGLAIGTLTLAFSRYVLGFDSALADNISANVIGVGIGTLFRFYSYRKWVFKSA
jgi:putative flippase GtrA